MAAPPEPKRKTKRKKSLLPPRTLAPTVSGGRGSVSSLPFLGLLAGVLSCGLLALLVINNSLAAGSFEQARLRAEQVALFEKEQALRQEVERLSSPTQLRRSASDLGMLPAATTAYFNIETGRILGIPQPAGKATESDPSSDSGVPPTPATEDLDPPASGTASDEAESPQLDAPTSDDSPPPLSDGDGAAITDSDPLSAYDRAVITGGIEE